MSVDHWEGTTLASSAKLTVFDVGGIQAKDHWKACLLAIGLASLQASRLRALRIKIGDRFGLATLVVFDRSGHGDLVQYPVLPAHS
jgi:hypothetical protein